MKEYWLDFAGVPIKEVYQNFAESLEKNINELSSKDKQQAILNFVGENPGLLSVENLFGKVEDIEL
jgi:hypothetical protein